MRFTATYEEESHGLPELDEESDSLKELVQKLEEMKVNDYHCLITEWDYDDLDCYGAPEIIASTRLFEIQVAINCEGIEDLSNYIEY